ncbi:MAG: 50S ribosomal protein L25 [Carnobacterium sp.]|uniref:50S ribosomal protein L25 n=1 Tax=unclassified Carnobacterium TaxID=257487 RepID=UPI00191467FF|nr:50S ribosomal protein L25 [Carnobacterium sp. CS13]QQP69953.1 50S ribosomal protein L25 [Carnobacterium sp. CS13]
MKINAELRTEVGTSSANRYRRENKIPAVVYNKGSETTPVLLDSKDFDKVLKELGKNGIFDIVTAEGKSKQVIIKDFQSAALKYQILDVELQAITKDQKLTVTVPIILSGAEGVKEGLVSQTLNELEIETTPANIPTEFTADVSALTIGDSLTVADLSVDKEITVFNEQDETVAIVAPPTVMEEPAEPAEASDPEVIGEKEA